MAGATPVDMQIQILTAQLEQLKQERDEKVEQLRECEKNVRGFKAAGIATLSATGVGIGVNIGLASQLAAVKSGADGVKTGASAGALKDTRSVEEIANDNEALFAELGI